MAAQPNPDRHAADGHAFRPEEAVRRLGHRVRSEQGGRRPDRRLAGARRAATTEVQAVNYVAWFNIRDGINHDDPATADLQQVTVASPGFIAKAPNATIDFTPLLTSQRAVGADPGGRGEDAGPGEDPGRLQAGGRPAGDRRAGARRAEVRLHRPAAAEPTARSGRTISRPTTRRPMAPANLVVVADSDILADRFWVRIADFFGQQTATPFSDNGPFVANLIGTLAGGDALIGLRSRGDSNRPFTLVNAMQAEAEAQFRQTEQALQHASGRRAEAVADAAPGQQPGDTEQAANAQAVITPEQRAAIDAARQGHRRDAAEAARGAVRPEPQHLAAGERAAGVRHRAGAGGADGPGDRAGHRAPPPACEGTGMRSPFGHRHGGRRPAIHDLLCCPRQSLGWRAFARHDDSRTCHGERRDFA